MPLVHTEEVTGSIPVSPTDVRPAQRLYGRLSSYAPDGSCHRIGRNLGDSLPVPRATGPSRGSPRPGSPERMVAGYDWLAQVPQVPSGVPPWLLREAPDRLRQR